MDSNSKKRRSGTAAPTSSHDLDARARGREALLDSMPDPAWLKDAQGRFLAVNRAFCERHGLKPETTLGMTDFDILPRDRAARMRHEDDEVMSSRVPLTYESEQEFHGRRYWIEAIKAPTFNAAGEVTGTVGAARDITARKVAERRLQDSESHFRALAGLSSDWYWEQDREFRFVRISDRATTAFEFSGVIGKRLWELPIRGVTDEQWRAHRETVQAHLAFHGFHYTTIVPGGTGRQFSISGKPLYDEDGRFAGYIGIGSDITERVAAQQELQLAKERLELALQGSGAALWDVILETGETYLSERWATFLGLPARETRATTRELMTLVHPDDVADAKNASRATIEGSEDEYTVEHRVRAVDGSWKWILSRGRVTARSPEGKALRMSGTNLDITTRKTMEDSLRHALQESEVLFQTSPTALALVRDRIIVRCNPAMEKLFGAQPGGLVGRLMRVLFADEKEWRKADEQTYAAITRGETFVDDFHFVRAGGEQFWAAVAGRLVEPGSPDALFSYADITAQQQLAHALAAAKEAADAANRAKSSFLATMSHEIRTPMNGVLGMLELLELSTLDSAQRQTLSTARDSAVALLRLIDDILDFSKIEAGQLEIRPEPVSLSAIAKRSATIYLELASRKGLLLECHVDPQIAPAHFADGLRISQIVNNLLSNAIKFTASGKITLAFESVEHTTSDELVRLRVTDTGIGVPAEQQGRLFQPFVQADSETTRKYGGTGLGLSICRRLAELMSGNIALESELGVGTTMTVLLRLPITNPAALDHRNSARLEQLAKLSRNAQTTATPPPATLRILIAEDHPLNLELIQRQVSILGYATDLAHDGVEALEKWQAGGYALVLTDCHMPRMDGYQLAREIRRIEAASGTPNAIPIIACTANALASDASRCFEAGMSDYLPKPIMLPALKVKLELWSVPPQSSAAPAGAPAAAAGPAVQPAIAANRDATDNSPVDDDMLGQITGGGEAVKRDILRRFLAANQTDVDNLREVIEKKNTAAIAKLAHRLKGASFMIGANPFAAVADRIERAARADDYPAVAQCAEDFEHERSRLVAHLQAKIGPG